MKKHHVRVEIRKEKVAHHEPHLHVVHSDKIDASLSLRTFEVLAGKIDTGTHRYFRGLLASEREKLLAIWQALNDEEDIATAHALIEDLAF